MCGSSPATIRGRSNGEGSASGRAVPLNMVGAVNSGYAEYCAWFHHWRVGKHPRLRLLCLPYAGGGGFIFRPWGASDAIPDDVAVCSVQLPGRENRYRERGYCDMPALVEHLADAMPRLDDLPFVLFGHSMGAFIGFELARSLRRKGLQGPVHLVMSGAAAPQSGEPGRSPRDLDDAELIRRVRRVGGMPESVLDNPELVRMAMPILRADFSMMEAYRPQQEAPLDCPITAFGGSDDPIVSLSSLASWVRHTVGSFAMEVLPGDHFFINHQRDALLDRVGRLLSEVAT